jgi:hypothetical protein
MSRWRGVVLISASALAGAGLWTLSAVAGPGGMPHAADQSLVVRTASGDSGPATVKTDKRKGVKVDAPYTQVEAGRRVRVDAPYSYVDVNPDRRRVRVEAPYVDLNIKW